MRASFSWLMAFLASATPAAAQQPSAASASRISANPRVRTANGVLSGLTAPSGVRMFRGIPFAAPPVRERRWRPPEPAPAWTGVRRADRFADQCFQARVFADMVFRSSGTSEDCLYLNVWAPAVSPDARLPVLVYFFGGGFIAGDASEPRYDGEALAARGMIVVTVNYRLGVFGFLAHPELSRESPHHASGNYAFMDQAAALRWVHANIAAFGGDPARVTIGGESAGSFSVSAQMASPLAKDLFAGAIGESGAFFSQTIGTPSLAESEGEGAKFAVSAGVRTIAALRALSPMELLAAATRPGAGIIGPNVDGWFLRETPAVTFAAGRQARVPLLAGWNSEESGPGGVLSGPPTPDSVMALLKRTFGDCADEAARAYPAATPDEALQAATDLAGDRFIAYSTWKWMELHAATSGKPVWRYLFAKPRPASVDGSAPAGRGAVHSAEIEYALGNLRTNRVFAWTPDDFAVSEAMQRYFANFVKTGDPNGPGLPAWPPGAVAAGGNAMRMRIDVTPRAEAEPRARYLLLDALR